MGNTLEIPPYTAQQGRNDRAQYTPAPMHQFHKLMDDTIDQFLLEKQRKILTNEESEQILTEVKTVLSLPMYMTYIYYDDHISGELMDEITNPDFSIWKHQCGTIAMFKPTLFMGMRDERSNILVTDT